MQTLTASPARGDRRARSIRARAGVAKTFGPLFAVLSLVLVLPGGIILYDALVHPFTADAGQVVMGSTFIAFALLLVFFLVRDRSRIRSR